jgi:histidine triad (HIT) family protein
MSQHPTDPSCVFCKIIAGQIPSHKVYEDDLVFAFLDIGPLVRGHTLVIPKAHYATVMETPADVFGQASSRIPKIAHAVLAATQSKACHVLTNNGTDAMQSVAHLHFHIIPRRSGDRFQLPWNTTPLVKEQALALAGAIAAAIQP